MHFYPHHIGDYRADTAHLSNEEDLAYRRLIEMYYDTEHPIPLDTQWVSRRLRSDNQTIQTVLDDFFFAQEDGWHHIRCDRELAEYRKLQEKNRANGKKGGRPKAQKPAPTGPENPLGSDSVSSGLPAATDSEGNYEPVTINHEPVLEPSPKARRRQQLPADFYPNQTGEAAATAKGLVIPVELQKFTDYHRSKGNVMADWQAAWRTWVGNARPSAMNANAETPYQRSMREKYEAVAPAVAARSPSRVDPNLFFDSLPTHPMEIANG